MAGRTGQTEIVIKSRPVQKRNNITERRLVDVLVQHLRKTHRFERELPVYERWVDLATVCPETDELWTIEAKISDWGRALAQAIVNLAAGERSYIAIHSKHVHCVEEGMLEQYGIGLISVGTKWDDVTVVRAARKSEFVNHLVAGRLKHRIKS